MIQEGAPVTFRSRLRAGGPSGDVDTVAAMASAMVGAAVGMSGLDVRLQAWSACLNGRDTFRRNDLVALAHQLK